MSAEKTRIFFSGQGLPAIDDSDSGKTGLNLVTISRPRFEKHYITVHPDKSVDPYAMFQRIANCAKEKNAMIISQFVFGGTELHGGGVDAIKKSCGEIQWPITWIQGMGASGKLLTGTQVYAISGNQINMIKMEGEIIGNFYEDDDARYCLLGDLRPHDTSLSRRDQTRKTFEKIERALGLVDMNFSNVVRTWIYIDSILKWYDEFNDVRTKFFNERGIFNKLVPASTGIGVNNPHGAALVTDVLAIKPKTDKVRMFAVPSPLQCPAIDYRSSFSRAVELQLPDHRQLFISGTASIEQGGATVHVGDTAKQIDLTMEVVKSIMNSRGMSWENTTRAIAYFKDTKDIPLLYNYCKAKNLPTMPIAIAHSDICRDDLLFEIEFDASIPT